MNKDLYKDEFGNYHEVEDEIEDPTDGAEDDELDITEDDSDDPFDSVKDDSEFDEDEEYANEHRPEYDSDED